MLTATELNLGTVRICYFKPEVIKKEFEFSEKLKPINILVIGYTDEKGDENRHDT